MHKFRALVTLNLKAMLNSIRFGGGKKRRRAASGMGAVVFLAGMALYLSGVYSFLFASQLAAVGMVKLIIMMMPVLAVTFGLMFTLFAAQGIIFGGRDNDLVLALPVPAFTLMLARTLALYAENLVFSVFVMLPAGVAYLRFGGEGGVPFFIVLLVGTCFLALLPTLLALIVGYILAWVSSKFSRRAFLSNILYFGFFALLMVVVFKLNMSMGNLAQYAMGMEQAFSGWGLPFLLLEQAACEGNIIALLELIALCAVPFFLVVWFFAGRYKKIVTGLGAKGARSDYKLGRVSASGCRRALLAKEARKFFGTPIYLFNSGFGLILLLVGSIASLFFRSTITEVLHQMANFAAELPVLPLLALAIGFFLSTVMITAPSISLEGRQLWILKTASISAQGIFLIKAGFQMLVTTPCLLVSVVCLSISFNLGAASGLLLLLLSLMFSLLVSLLGLFTNLCLPKLDAANDVVVVKQSASVLAAMFISWVVLAACGGLYALLWSRIGALAALLPALGLCAAGSAGLWWLLAVRGPRMFLEL